ncbi:MAG TPA: molecular chaperone HscC [Rhodanobacteraceae bacterium]|nr:molecular chaperone HscC [Rhodanobacteraceae bacterium]
MIVRIDLGTTNSLIGVFEQSQPRLFKNTLGGYLTPSVVSTDDDGSVIVGQAARDRLITHPRNTVAAFKRWMGSAKEVRLGNRSFRAEELSALVLRSLVADAEAETGEKIEEAVISVPAYFSDAQRKATRAAGELAGLRVEKLINEPTAAALAYGLRERPEGSRFLVFDLGGGTFDVSILELFEGVVQVHASAGDNFLGGEDFLDVLESACLLDLGFQPHTVAPGDREQVRRKLEQAKRSLSQARSAEVAITLAERELTWSIEEDRFEQLAQPLIQRLRAPLERAMRDANLQPSDLSEIVLVGGASRMPLVARTVSRMFGRLPLRHVDPDQAIALGAAIAAGMKARDGALEEMILTDVCPYSLGVEISRQDPGTGQRVGGFFKPIIQRNTTVPVSREDVFFPVDVRQSQINLRVFQGESPMVAHNILLGELDIGIVPGLPQDQQAVAVRFTYDINGVLQVEATIKRTGEKFELLLQQNPGVLDDREIRERLAALSALKIHPRERQENVATLARAERVYAERLAWRQTLEGWIARFRAIVESQDENMIRVERQQFEHALDQLEMEP